MLAMTRCSSRTFLLKRHSWKLPFLLSLPTNGREKSRFWSASHHRHHHRDTPTFKSSPPSSSDRRIITYLTDVEGDGAYFDRYVQQSRVLTFREIPPRFDDENCGGYFPYSHCIDFTNDDAVLVFGGDIWDKGGSDLYVVRQLLDLHRRYGPERVYWCFGNRDTNKMRILQEIGVSQQQALPRHDGVYWKPPIQADSGHPVSDDAAQRLLWILASTMGSPQAFELRRQELQREKMATDHSSCTSLVVTDDDVVESYRQSCHPGGELGQYLAKGHLVIRMGQVLFLHGALPITRELLKEQVTAAQQETKVASVWNDLRFAMPWQNHCLTTATQPTDHSPTIDDWMFELNQFARTCVAHWNEYFEARETSSTAPTSSTRIDEPMIWSTHGGYDTTNPSTFTNLIQYAQSGLPDGKSNPTIVYSSFCPQGSKPSRFFPKPTDPLDKAYYRLVQEFFQQSGVRLIVCGHQPQGDTLSPIRIESLSGPGEYHQDNATNALTEDDERSSNWILCCDTSYSGDTLWRTSNFNQEARTNLGLGNGPSFRGDHAVCEVLIEQCIATGVVLNVQYHGVLSDGSRYDTRLPLDRTNETDMTGTLASTSWVSSRVSSSELSESEYWWVKAKLGRDKYLITTAKGYDVWNSIVKLPL